jgi:hypothetical protein
LAATSASLLEPLGELLARLDRLAEAPFDLELGLPDVFRDELPVLRVVFVGVAMVVSPCSSNLQSVAASRYAFPAEAGLKTGRSIDLQPDQVEECPLHRPAGRISGSTRGSRPAKGG